MSTVRFGSGSGCSHSVLIRVGSKWIGFETGWVISGVGHFGSYQILGSVRLWIGLLQMFGSKSVVFNSDVGSGMDSGCSVRISGLGSVLPGLVRTMIGDTQDFPTDIGLHQGSALKPFSFYYSYG